MKKNGIIWEEVFLPVLLLAFVVFMLLRIDISSFNLSDGVYIYLSKALADGAALYKDIHTSPSPVIFLAGAAICRLGEAMSSSKVYAGLIEMIPYFQANGIIHEAYTLVLFRLFSILVFALNAWLVYRVTFRLYKNRKASLIAALILLFLPYGALESRTFMISPQLNMFALCALYCFLPMTGVSLFAAGVFGWAALFTKIVYLPVLLLNLIFLYKKDKKLLGAYFGGFFITMSVSFLLFMMKFSVPSAFFGQLAGETFHNMDIMKMGLKYLEAFRWEGGFFLLYLLGLYLLLKEYKQNIYFVLYSLVVMLVPLVSMSHMGTFQAIFVVAEPVIAVSAAVCIHKIYLVISEDIKHLDLKTVEGALRTAVIIFICLLGLLSFYPMQISLYNYTMSNADEITQARQAIQGNSSADDEVLVSGYFAYISSRRIFEHIADQYIFLSEFKRQSPFAVGQYGRLLKAFDAKEIKAVMPEPSGCIALPDISNNVLSNYYQAFSARSILLLPVPRVWVLGTNDGGVNAK